VAVDFSPAFGYLSFLHLELFGLLSETDGGCFDLRVPAFQPRLVPTQIAPHLRHLPLPGDELLAEVGDRQAMFLADTVEAGGLLANLVGFSLQLRACRLESFLPLLHVGVKLGQVFVQLRADSRQALAGRPRPLFPFWKLPL
jgi:hypothetical protein